MEKQLKRLLMTSQRGDILAAILRFELRQALRRAKKTAQRKG